VITLGSDADALIERLLGAGLAAVELYRKEGRNRTTHLEPGHSQPSRAEPGRGQSTSGQSGRAQSTSGPSGRDEHRRRTSQVTEERGWAVRAGTSRGSWLATGVGDPSPAGPWPELDGAGLRLPAAAFGTTAPGEAQAARDLDAPLLSEGEALALLATIETTLEAELPGTRLLAATLEDGAAGVEIANHLGLRAAYRQRVAVLHLWASWRGSDVRLYAGAREPRQFGVAAQARRLADRLTVLELGVAPERDRCEVVLAPEPAALLLRSLSPLLAEPSGYRRLLELASRSGRVGSERWTVIDDGRFPGGLLEAPADGEGVATRRIPLIEAGRPRQPLRTWRDGDEGWSGCVRRASYRDPPRPGFTHLFLAPDRTAAPADIVASVTRGLYVVEVDGVPQIDVEEDRFTLPVAGFALRSGSAAGAVRGCEVVGTLRGLFQGLEAVGRDLRFQQLEACFGSPTLLFSGLETRPR
jgi:predicted Zn-dependent protease